MNFGEAIASGFSNYVNFSSRAARSEYWYWVLFNVLAQVVTEIIDNAVIGMSVTTAIFSLAVLLPGIAVAARPRRRPHRAADLVLHQGHGRLEQVWPRSVAWRRASQPAPSSLIASSRANR